MKIKYPGFSTNQINIESFSAGMNTSKDASLTNLSEAISVENFAFNDGALKNGIGFEDLVESLGQNTEILKRDLEMINGFERVFHFYKYNQETNSREDKLLLLGSDMQLYYINLFDESKQLKTLRGITFTSLPSAVRYRLNGEDVIILSSETDNMVVWDGVNEPYIVLDAPKISSMTIHYERLFATVDGEKNAVWFSDDLDPTNWSLSLDEAGFIELIDERGALLKVVSFLDYVYIFREYGISRLTAYADQQTFAVSNLFVSSGKIYSNSVCVCGDRILFLAEDGLYSFDGVSTHKILENISNNLTRDNSSACACYHNGYYHLACNFAFHDENEESSGLNAVVTIEIDGMKLANISRGVKIKYLCTIENIGVVALAFDETKNAFLLTKLCKNASFFGKPLEKVWISPTTKLGFGQTKKTLRKIYIETTGEVSLFVYCDEKPKVFSFKGKNAPQAKRVNLPLNNFSFRLVSRDQTTNIKNLGFEFLKAKKYEE